MLSRVANNLFWLSRQIERAENTAWMLDVTYRMPLLPYRLNAPGEPWAQRARWPDAQVGGPVK